MATNENWVPPRLTAEQFQLARGVLDDFDSEWAAWRKGTATPDIAGYLKRVSEKPIRDYVLARLLQADGSFRQSNARQLLAGTYEGLFPGHRDIIAFSCDELSLAAKSTADGTEETYTQIGNYPREPVRRVADGGPTRFGEYDVLEKIAQGGMGVVYKARHTTLGRVVALKLIRSGGLGQTDDELKRFKSEAQAAAQLDHPGIVPVFEVGQQDGNPFYAMGYVDGGDLEARLNDGPLEPKHAAELMLQVSRALSYAHGKGIIHRDLKPRNIMLNEHGEARITDFGLARRLDGADGLTLSGQVVGTPSYMPPEQAAGKRQETGPHSDIYSVGALLYALVVGRPPFRAANPVETLRQVVEDQPIPIRRFNRSVPRDLETICLKCLEKDAVRRYASADELAKDLRHFLNNEPITARPCSVRDRLWKWTRRRPVVAALVATVILLVIAGIVGAGDAYRRVVSQRNEAYLNLSFANRQTDRALQALKVLVFDVQEELVEFPGSDKLQRNILENAASELEVLASSLESAPDVDRSLVQARVQLGELFQTIGSTKRADEQFRKAYATAQELVREFPNSTGMQMALCLAALRLANVEALQGRPSEAAELFRVAEEVAQGWEELDPELRQSALATFDNLGGFKAAQGDLEGARQYFERSFQLAQQLLVRGDRRTEADFALAGERLGDAYLQLGSLQLGIEHVERGLEIRLQHFEDNPQNTSNRRNLAGSLITRGRLALMENHAQDALVLLQQALAITRETSEQYPNSLADLRELAVALDMCGRAHLHLAQIELLEACYTESISILQSLVEKDPDNEEFRRDLASGYVHLAESRIQHFHYLDTKATLAAATAIFTGLRGDQHSLEPLCAVLLTQIELVQQYVAGERSLADEQDSQLVCGCMAELIRAQRSTEALAASNRLADLELNAVEAYNVACCYAKCAEELTKAVDSERPAGLKEQFAVRAVFYLNEAERLGLFANADIVPLFERDPFLSILKERPDFQELRTRILRTAN